jgi:hypothetical protein
MHWKNLKSLQRKEVLAFGHAVFLNTFVKLVPPVFPIIGMDFV